MSYCRFGPNSDVYVLNGNECCGCKLGVASLFESKRYLLDHLILHIEHGHKVPRIAINRLLAEIENDLPAITNVVMNSLYELIQLHKNRILSNHHERFLLAELEMVYEDNLTG